MRRILIALIAVATVGAFSESVQAQYPGAQQRAFGRVWGGAYGKRDWERFYHYPYVYYPQNFWASEYFRSSEDLYHRYPAEMRIPVYTKKNWHNFLPKSRRYHSGHQFMLDYF